MVSRRCSVLILTVHFKRQFVKPAQTIAKLFSRRTHSSSRLHDSADLFRTIALRKAKQAHTNMIKLGLSNSLPQQNKILNSYVKCNEFHVADKLFDEMRVRNLVTWNTLISGIVSRGNDQASALNLGFTYFKRMLIDKVPLDHISFNGLFRVCVELHNVESGKELHCLIVKLGFDVNCYVSTGLVDFYGKCGLVEEAIMIFDDFSYRDLVLWNVMISCYVLNCMWKEAFSAFGLMKLGGFKGDEFTFSSLLNSAGAIESCELGKQIHVSVIKLSFESDIQVASALVDMYAKNNNINEARKCFLEMKTRNLVAWNTIIVGYGQHGDGKEAMRLLKKMLLEYFHPDELTFSSVISSGGNITAVCEIMQVHSYIFKAGFQSSSSISNSLINSYSKCGNIASAFECYSSVAEPDVITFTSIITALGFHGFAKESITIFEKMVSSRVTPDRISFLGVLSACSHVGLVNEGIRYFNLMTNAYNITPDSEHYACLIDLLGRAGFLDEAYNVLISIPFEPKSDTLGAFIRSCKAYGNIEFAKLAAEKLLRAEPNKPVNYSVLSNIYASEGNWLEVAKVRQKMKESCDYKVPGHSWMDVHPFLFK